MKKILFTLKFYPIREVKLAEKLNCHEITSLAVGFSRRWSSFARDSGNFKRVYDFTEFLQTEDKKCQVVTTELIERLKRWQELYGIPNLERFIAADRTMRTFSWERNTLLLNSLFSFLEDIFISERPDAIVGELATASDLIAWSMADKLELPYINQINPRLWDDRFAICNVSGHWDGLAETYDKLKAEGLQQEDREFAINFLNEFKSRKQQPSYMQFYKARALPRIMLQRLSRLPNKLSSYPVDKKYAVDYQVPFSVKIKEDSQSVLRRTLTSVKFFRVFDQPQPFEPFMLFPLQYQPESAIMTFAPYHENQLAVAENIAKSVPVGYKLYVKEHTPMWGKRPLWFYKALKAIPNVKIINHRVDIHDLIKHSAAVIVVNSTTGLEAILYGKPVVVLGNVFYDVFNCVYKIHSYEELPYALLKATNEFKPDHEEILISIYSLKESTYEGNMDAPSNNINILEEANIQKLTDFLVQRLDR